MSLSFHILNFNCYKVGGHAFFSSLRHWEFETEWASLMFSFCLSLTASFRPQSRLGPDWSGSTMQIRAFGIFLPNSTHWNVKLELELLVLTIFSVSRIIAYPSWVEVNKASGLKTEIGYVSKQFLRQNYKIFFCSNLYIRLTIIIGKDSDSWNVTCFRACSWNVKTIWNINQK